MTEYLQHVNLGWLWLAAVAAGAAAAGLYTAVDYGVRAGRSRRERAAAWLRQCQPPAIDTQPGTNQQLLDDCNAIYDTDARREKP